MKFSTKTRYGLRAMIEIALCSPKQGIYQKDISTRQNISNKYLDYIIHALKATGLISNVQGKSGYILTRKPSEITVYDIHRAFEPELAIINCLRPGLNCEYDDTCATKIFWNKLNSSIVNYMKECTLEELVKNHKKLNRKKTLSNESLKKRQIN